MGVAMGGVQGTFHFATTPGRAAANEITTYPSSDYINASGRNSLNNVKTNVNPSEFAANLEKSGFVKNVSKDGKSTVFTKGTAKYSLRESSQTSRGTPGASADYSNGTKQPTLKIRLGQNNN